MKLTATEEQECMNFVTIVRYQYPAVAELMYHIPNGGFRNEIEGRKFKRMGVLAGVSDYCIPVARGAYHSLYIEMKRKAGGSVKGSQARFIWLLRQQNIFADVCNGCEDAIRLLSKYLNLQPGEQMDAQFLIDENVPYGTWNRKLKDGFTGKREIRHG